ncbi:putative protein serine/threonine kinase [Heterostelium album PN500]|uniref:non-specific serine/threonine protein kinase n=1 Tax=Heterostelium pallidum (strain ATCC 26659 / Pp 5 / PN500) TaxID=670386 RepID=D3BCK5_HETP5|nr:putative protein serine/threonine kinase [Heterostelium album PN500]EFA80647.1 putative protein serine/threonine kinase [Heterostelium album PN500]|eukprot:XP_020432767.1 putative protein serine/threonine kinase [Heterostelium album PN500]
MTSEVAHSYIDQHLDSIQEETGFFINSLPTITKTALKVSSCKRIGNYILGKTIGSGTSSKVKIGTNIITGKKVAIKITKPKRVKERKEIEREISILKLLKHGNIIQLYDAIYDEERGRICLILELVSGGELFDYIVARGRLSEREARKFLRQILAGLIYCHSNNVCHRDLKLENLLVDDMGNIKISDFGYSNISRPGFLLSTFCGSPVYAPPEILLEKKYNGHEVDIWSVGVILYAMVTGQLPWSLTDGVQVEGLDRLLKGEFKFPPNILLSSEVKDLINRMIVANPSDRAKLSEIKSHVWTNKGYELEPDEEYNRKNNISNNSNDDLNHYGTSAEQSQGSKFLKVNRSPLYNSSPNLQSPASPRGASISINSACCSSPNLMGTSPNMGSPAVLTPPLSPISSSCSTASSPACQSPPTPSTPSLKSSLFHGLFKKRSPSSRHQQFNNITNNNSNNNNNNNNSNNNNSENSFDESSKISTSPSSECSTPSMSSPPNNPGTPSNNYSNYNNYGYSKRRFSLEDVVNVIRGKNKTPKDKLRSIKGPFTAGTTTTLQPSDISRHLEDILISQSIKYQQNGYVFECKQSQQDLSSLSSSSSTSSSSSSSTTSATTAEPLSFEIEICRVSGMDLYGIKFKRQSGDVWFYSVICKKITDAIQF